MLYLYDYLAVSNLTLLNYKIKFYTQKSQLLNTENNHSSANRKTQILRPLLASKTICGEPSQ